MSADPLVAPLQAWARRDAETGTSDGRSRSSSSVSLHLAAIFAGGGKPAQDGRKSPTSPATAPQPLDRHGAWEHQYECERHCECEYTAKGSTRGFRSDRNAWIQLGYAARADGRDDEAQEHFERALILDPAGETAAIAHLNLGILAAKRGAFESAHVSLQSALDLQPQFAEAHYEIGRLLYRQHRARDSVERFRSALECLQATPQPLRPELLRAKVRKALALALVDEGRHSEAKQLQQEALGETEASMAMHPVSLSFCSEEMEHSFAVRRSARAAWTTRSLLLLGILQMTVSLSFIMVGPHHERSHLYVALYVGGAISCLANLLATLHRRFWACKSLSIAASIILVMGVQLLTLVLLLTDSVTSWNDPGKTTIEMDKELVQAIIMGHLQFALLFACPQLFGLRWITMLCIVAVFMSMFVPLWVVLPSAHVFFPPAYLTIVLLLVVVVSRTVEKQERLWFRATQLRQHEQEAMAQYEAFWRAADADRHASDLRVAKAKTALQIRNQTTAFLFHEIRNPLHALHGAVERMGQTDVPDEKRAKYSRIARSSMGMVRNVLDDVLLLSKIEEGRIKFSKVAFGLVPWLEELEEMFSEQATVKGLTLESKTCGLDPKLHVVADRNRLAEVVANLLGNAVKFTVNGRITLKIEQQASTENSVTVDVTVTDTGPGLSEEQISSLFEPYTTLSDSSAVDAGGVKGTGLGLVISKQLIRAHGGEVFVRSEGIGSGSTFGFRITLPTQPASPGHCTSFFSTEKSTQPSVEERFNLGETRTRQSESAQKIQQHDPRRRRLLVVDDDELNRCITADILSGSHPESGWALEVDTAVDGLEALELLHVHQYDCVVTDIIMPRLDGRGLARKIREEELGVPVVGLTGCAAELDIQSSLDSGMVACLPKPVDLRTLIRTVRQAMV